MKLKKLYENTQETVFTPEQKRSFIEAVKRFNEYGDQVYRTEGIRKAVKEISTVVKQAEQLTIQETQDWFDGVAVKRDMKGLSEATKLFEKTALQNKIPLQKSAHNGALTDLSYVQLVGKGVACIDVGFPLRYSHSSLEICDLNDLIQLTKLLGEVLDNIDGKIDLNR